ncbi:hypothetical protein B0F90DRAFT_1752671 [Multifurca ochricompacta]|uniref:Uncharacterized protein n=1 Tax=Multifurca ochricompacta TaxID=376703 RepID=A0AAD4QJL9_9AGAM|nr:hypothetical protein B0F90DRAFT_1752671 [Multifurca ochricompacta]
MGIVVRHESILIITSFHLPFIFTPISRVPSYTTSLLYTKLKLGSLHTNLMNTCILSTKYRTSSHLFVSLRAITSESYRHSSDHRQTRVLYSCSLLFFWRNLSPLRNHTVSRSVHSPRTRERIRIFNNTNTYTVTHIPLLDQPHHTNSRVIILFIWYRNQNPIYYTR